MNNRQFLLRLLRHLYRYDLGRPTRTLSNRQVLLRFRAKYYESQKPKA